MLRREGPTVRAVLATVLALVMLAGCAPATRSSQGIEWVQWQEAEKKRLDDAGFPQYTGAP